MRKKQHTAQTKVRNPKLRAKVVATTLFMKSS
jgi:hypothetical protein